MLSRLGRQHRECVLQTCKDEVIAVIEVHHGLVNIRRPFQYPGIFVGLDGYQHHHDKYAAPVLLVTESPHIEEFRVSNVSDFYTGDAVNARPVNGASGRNIMLHLVTVIARSGLFLPDGHYPVIVMNALQEQCSEGKDTLVCRTRNFLNLWEEKKTFLASRLADLTPLMVVSACTVGDFYQDDGTAAYGDNGRFGFEANFHRLLTEAYQLKKAMDAEYFSFMATLDLAGLVLDVIHQSYADTDIPVFKTTHPAAWRNRAPVLKRYATHRLFYERV